LDDVTGKTILNLLDDLNRELGKTIVLITHNVQIAELANKVIHVRNGEIDRVYLNQTRKLVSEIDW
jgi:putative ABC transport system ATP-binding protein